MGGGAREGGERGGSQQRRRQLRLRHDQQIGIIERFIDAELVGEELPRRGDTPTDGHDDGADPASGAGAENARRVDALSAQQLPTSQGPARESLSQGGRQRCVLFLNGIEVGAQRQDRVKSEEGSRRGGGTHEVRAAARKHVLRTRQCGAKPLAADLRVRDAKHPREEAAPTVGEFTVSALNDDHAVAQRVGDSLARLARRGGLGGHAHKRGLGARRGHGLVEGGPRAKGKRYDIEAAGPVRQSPPDLLQRDAGR